MSFEDNLFIQFYLFNNALSKAICLVLKMEATCFSLAVFAKQIGIINDLGVVGT